MTEETEDTEIGHNGLPGEELLALIERIEQLEEEKSALSADIKDVYTEAKSSGFEAPIIRKLVAARRKDQAKLREENERIRLYAEAIGQLDLFP